MFAILMKNLVFLFFFLISIGTKAQILQPAKWNYSVSAPEARVGDEVELIFKATIEKNWYLYSSEFPCEDPIKTSFNLVPHSSFELVGKLVPINPVDKYDDIFECDVKIFKKEAEFRQKIKILASPLQLTGESDYQVCSDLTGQCISSADDFSFNIKVSGGGSIAPTTETGNGIESSKVKAEVPLKESSAPVIDSSLVSATAEEKSLWGFMLVAFIAGLAALLTP